MKARMSIRLMTTLVILLSLLLVSIPGCDSSDDAANIPNDVVEMADGIFSGIIGPALDPADTSYRPGMVVTESGNTITITLTDFTFPDEPDIFFSGQIEASIDAEGKNLTLLGTLTITGYTYSSVSINGNAFFSNGIENQEEPDTISGTFKVDDTEYDLQAVVDRVDQLEE